MTGGTVDHGIRLTVNGREVAVAPHPDRSLLEVLRYELGLTGTKYGCGEGECGACTVIIDGTPARSCSTLMREVEGKRVVTIEGIPAHHPVKKAWLAEEVSQCGYCQPGQVVSAVVLLSRHRHPTDRQIDDAMYGNICRCGSYARIRKAIHRAAARRGKGGKRHE